MPVGAGSGRRCHDCGQGSGSPGTSATGVNIVYGSHGGDWITVLFVVDVAALAGMMIGSVLAWHRNRLPKRRHRR